MNISINMGKKKQRIQFKSNSDLLLENKVEKEIPI